MCGLVALINPLSNGFVNADLDLFEQSMILNMIRGDDSTGIVSVDNKDVWRWASKLGHPKRLLGDNTSYGPIRNELFARGRLVFGHGRSATVGSVTIENAHPFQIKRPDKSNLILIHNGTLQQYQTLPGFKDADVDSKWMAEKIAELGPEEALSKINGAIATMWWDERDNSFNIYRNYDRPLWIGHSKCGRMLLNSQKDVIEWMMFKHKYEPRNEVYELAPYTWGKLIPNKSIEEWTNTKIERVYNTQGGKGGHQSNFPHASRQQRRHRGRGQLMGLTTPGAGNTEINPYGEETDDYLLVEGWVTRIEWENGKKITHYMGGSSYEEDEERDDLLVRKYYRDDKFKREICEVYLLGKGSNPNAVRLVVRNVEDEAEALELQTRPDVEQQPVAIVTEKKPVGSSGRGLVIVPDSSQEMKMEDLKVVFRKGQPARWHSPGPNGKVIRHRAISDNYPCFFSWYKNDDDGEFKPGDELQLEYVYSAPLQGKFIKAFCSLARPKQEVAMEFVFQTDKWDKVQLRKIAFFKAKIQWIRCMTPQERQSGESNGSVVQVFVKDVEPLTA